MRKINNPFVKREGYHCFGCSPGHPTGLNMSFTEDGDEILSTWEPTAAFEGYHGVLHGGIQATLMDEIASWVVYVKVKTAGLTAGMNVRYHKPVYISGGALHIHAHVIAMRRNLADIEVKIYNPEHELCSEGVITYYTFNEKRSREEFFYPGGDAFFPAG